METPLADEEQYISFPQYVMQTMHEEGENHQHLVERVISNVWANTTRCAHVFDVVFVVNTGTWEGLWVARTEKEWDEWLLYHDLQLRDVIAETIKKIEDELLGGNDA